MKLEVSCCVILGKVLRHAAMTHPIDTIEDDFRAEVFAYIEATGISPTAFGMKSVNDPAFINGLRAGERELRLSTMRKVREWMLSNPPVTDAAE